MFQNPFLLILLAVTVWTIIVVAKCALLAMSGQWAEVGYKASMHAMWLSLINLCIIIAFIFAAMSMKETDPERYTTIFDPPNSADISPQES